VSKLRDLRGKKLTTENAKKIPHRDHKASLLFNCSIVGENGELIVNDDKERPEEG